MNISKSGVWGHIRRFLMIAALVALDQTSKYLVRLNLTGGRDIPIIRNVLILTYVENRGSAWGLFSGLANSTLILSIVSIVILIIVLFIYFNIDASRKYAPLRLLTLFIVAGAAGNLFDRIVFGYVTDFIYFKPIDFPVFNVADCYITVSCFVLIILMLTKYRKDDLEFLSPKKKEITHE